jgi:hypothetical protein
MSPRDWQPASPGAAVSDALLDPFARGRVADRLDPAVPQAGHDQLQALPPPIHVQQGLGLVKDPSHLRRIGTWLDSISRAPDLLGGYTFRVSPCSTLVIWRDLATG